MLFPIIDLRLSCRGPFPWFSRLHVMTWCHLPYLLLSFVIRSSILLCFWTWNDQRWVVRTSRPINGRFWRIMLFQWPLFFLVSSVPTSSETFQVSTNKWFISIIYLYNVQCIFWICLPIRSGSLQIQRNIGNRKSSHRGATLVRCLRRPWTRIRSLTPRFHGSKYRRSCC